MQRGLVAFMVFILAILASVNALAHQQKAAITKVLFNARSGNLEVMHRFNLHDAEHAVKEIFGKNADIIASTDTQTQFAEYVTQRFTIDNGGDTPLTLNTVGYEIEGKFFWVYQDTPLPNNTQVLRVSHYALRDLWPKQVNTVNIEGLGDIRTLTFEQSADLLEVKF